MDPFYIKIFCVFGIIVSFILALDYLVQLLFYSYFKKDVNVIIPTKLPKIVYSYLKELQLLTKLDISYSKFFLYNLVLYIFIFVSIFIFIFALKAPNFLDLTFIVRNDFLLFSFLFRTLCILLQCFLFYFIFIFVTSLQSSKTGRGAQVVDG